VQRGGDHSVGDVRHAWQPLNLRVLPSGGARRRGRAFGIPRPHHASGGGLRPVGVRDRVLPTRPRDQCAEVAAWPSRRRARRIVRRRRDRGIHMRSRHISGLTHRATRDIMLGPCMPSLSPLSATFSITTRASPAGARDANGPPMLTSKCSFGMASGLGR